MAVRNIRTYGDPCVKTKSSPVEDFDGALAELVGDLSETMYEKRGIGLAASQIGVNLRVFVMDVEWVDEDGEELAGKRNPRAFVNPEILWESETDGMQKEGCLSLPDLEGEVYRPNSVRLRWRDASGGSHEQLMEGLQARCVQHELDHLDGILFVDRMPFEKRRLLAGKLRQLKEKSANS